MRPIRLSFAGLQSYREKQELDFNELLGGGLFGIFGPTGSGKSTILDAITLALYGKVGRAKGGTYGIMNQSENRLWVKFSFALGSEGEYRVERSYKREKESPSLRSEHARLVHVRPEGDLVLADKERDVTQQVTDLLGLQLEDFTRAVVLPQGQFAEFMKLSGRDRTQMLQRIFSLTQYGDGLNQRLKRRVELVEKQLTAVQSEQIGLGDASAEALAQAEAALAESEQQLKAAEQELLTLEAQMKGWERVWELQQELDQVADGLRRWQQGASQVEGWRSELTAARRAEAVRPHLQAREQAELQARGADERLSAAQQQLAQARQALVEAVSAHEGAKARRVNEAPALVRRQGELQRALELESALAEARQRASDLEGRVAKGQSLCKEIGRQLREAEESRQGLIAQEAALRQRLSQVEVSGEERSRVAEALRLLERLREAEKASAESQRRLTQRRQQERQAQADLAGAEAHQRAAEAELAVVTAQLQRHESEPPTDEADLRAQEAWLVRAEEQIQRVADLLQQLEARQQEAANRRDQLTALQAEVAAATATAEQLQASLASAQAERGLAREARESAQRQAHAAALATALAPGCPCPVCGGTEHPHPASPEQAADLMAAEERLAQAESALREVELALERASQQRLAILDREQAASERAQESQVALAQLEEELQGTRARLPESWRPLGPETLRQSLQQEAAEQEARKAAHQSWQAQLLALRQRREEQAGRLAQAAAEAAGRRATANAAAQTLAEGEAEAHAQEEELAKRQSAFDQARGELDAAGVEAGQSRIEAADREAQRLRQEQEQLRQAEQAQQERLAELRQREQEYTQLLHQRELELAQAAQRREELQAEWSRLTGGEPASPLLAAATERLHQLEEAEATAARVREAAEAEGRQAEATHAAAQRELELARTRSQEAADALAQALMEADFADGPSAREALRPAQRQAELEGQIRGYEQEGDRLQSRQQALTDQLAGRSLSEAEWQGWQERRSQAREVAVAYREERARAMQVREDLLAKQRRWQELEEQRATLSTQSNHLDELRSLLRGNAFVDFLAEEQMSRVAAEASLRLGQLTRFRYGLETEEGGGFMVRDDGNGGAYRSVSTLSGGETFLASLSLALALSAQIQLRGHFPLEFFFLDEGFGTLDPVLLDVVISTLERLHFENLQVGVISHVPELRSRLQRRVIVEPAEGGGRGSRITLERA